jgi:hypothetical protein
MKIVMPRPKKESATIVSVGANLNHRRGARKANEAVPPGLRGEFEKLYHSRNIKRPISGIIDGLGDRSPATIWTTTSVCVGRRVCLVIWVTMTHGEIR